MTATAPAQTYAPVPIGELCEFLNGGTPSKANVDFWNGDIPWITSAEINDGEVAPPRFKITQDAIDESSTRLVPAGTLLLVIRTGVGKVGVAPYDLTFNQDINAVLPDPKRLDKQYLRRFLESQGDHFDKFSRGATVKGITREHLGRLAIPIPFPDDPRRSLAEQKRIAAILDKADAIRRRRQEAARLADTLIPNLYFELFGDPLGNNRKWPTAKVETLCDLVRGSSPRPRSDPSFYGGPIPRLMIEDITRDGKYVTPRIDTLTELGATMSRPVVAGTVVMAVSGNVGLVARVLVDACIHDGFVGFKDLDTKAVRADYFMWTLDLLKASHAKRKAGAIWQNLTTHQVKAMDMPLPPPTLQDRFEKLSKRLVKFAQSYTTRVEEVDGLFNSLVQRAFRGEL